ncbi:MAG: family 10 glycosylhydrolase, partial [Verrucomicrobiota bacterium]
GVRHMLDMCKAAGWSKVYWRVFDGGRACYNSKLLRPMGKWDDDSFWTPKTDEDKALLQRYTPNMTPEQRAALVKKFDAMDYGTFDTLEAAVTYGHKIGLEIHAWLTINEEDHGWGLRTEFSKKHPEFRWRKRDGTFYRSQLSFAFPEVRKYKLALVKELLAYDIDGFFFDWIRTGDVRDNPQTDADGVAGNGYEEPLVKSFKSRFEIDPHEIPNSDERWVRMRAEPQTEFVRAARKLIRSHRRTLPISALVGHPWHYRGEQNKIDGNLRGLLLDVTTWAREELVDSVVAAGYYRDGGNAEMAYQALRKETEGKVDVWMYAWVPSSAAEVEQTFALADKVSAKEILFWEADYIDDRVNASEIKTAMSKRATH